MRNVKIAFLKVDREKKGAGKKEGLHKSVITINHKIVQKCWKYFTCRIQALKTNRGKLIFGIRYSSYVAKDLIH